MEELYKSINAASIAALDAWKEAPAEMKSPSSERGLVAIRIPPGTSNVEIFAIAEDTIGKSLIVLAGSNPSQIYYVAAFKTSPSETDTGTKFFEIKDSEEDKNIRKSPVRPVWCEIKSNTPQQKGITPLRVYAADVVARAMSNSFISSSSSSQPSRQGRQQQAASGGGRGRTTTRKKKQ